MNSHARSSSARLAVLAVAAFCVVAQGADSAASADAPERMELDLAGCVAYAQEHALDLAQQRLALASALLNTRIAWAKFVPTVSASASHTEGAGATPASASLAETLPAGFELSASANTADIEGEDPYYSIRLSKRLLGGGSTYAESMLTVRNLELEELAAANRLNLFRRNLTRRVVKQYYRLLSARQTLQIRERRLEMSRTNLEHTIAREDPLDIANAELEVPAGEASVARAKSDIDAALDSMKELVGLPVSTTLVLHGELAFAPVAIDVEHDIAQSAEQHEDILNARLALEKLRNELPARKSAVLPSVDVSIGATYDAAARDSDWRAEGRVAASWTLLSSAERARLRLLRNQIADSELELEALLRNREITLRNYARQLAQGLVQVTTSRRRLDVAERRASLYSDRYENGEIGILEHIRAQNDLEEVRVALLESEISYLETLADYQYAAGLPVTLGATP